MSEKRLSAEPSMDEILASIRRILAEDDAAPPPPAARTRGNSDVLDLTEALFAEEHFVADEKRRHAEDAAGDGRLSISDELLLDGVVLRPFHETIAIESGLLERFGDDARIVHLEPVFPNRGEYGLDVGLRDARRFRRDKSAHDEKRIDGEMRIEAEFVQAVFLNEATDF